MFLLSFIFFVIVVGWIEYSSLEVALRDSTRKRWPAHIGLFTMSLAIQISLPIGAVVAAMVAETNAYGVFNWLNVPLALEAVFSVITMSFSYYLLHLLMHKVPVLWRLHQVHHSDYKLDISTAYRTHPISVILTLAIIFLVISLLGAAPEVVIFYSGFVLTVDLLHHSSLNWPAAVERVVGKLLITPSQHHIHHSDYQPETDTNFSADFCLWDKVFGTFLARPLRHHADFKYGLKEVSSDDAVDIHAILLSPFVRRNGDR